MTFWGKRRGEPSGFLSLPLGSAWPEINRGHLRLRGKAEQDQELLLSARLRAKIRQELLRAPVCFRVPVILITHEPEEVAAPAATVAVSDAARLRRVGPRQDADQHRGAAGLRLHLVA